MPAAPAPLTTIFASLLVSYLIVATPMPEIIRRVILLVYLIAIVGISSHWKEWNQKQKYVINNIGNNQELSSYKGKEPIFVSGNQYSKMGPFSHIEFLSENWVVNSIMKLAVNEDIDGKTLNKRFVWSDGFLIDNKYKYYHFYLSSFF